MGQSVDAQVMVNGAMASTNTLYSAPSNLLRMRSASWQFSWTDGASPVGTASILASNSFNPQRSLDAGAMATALTAAVAAGHFQEVPGSAVAVSGNSGTHVIALDLGRVRAKWFVLRYVNASGTATANAFVAAGD